MMKDLRSEIEKVAAFLGKSVTEEQIDLLRNHLHIDTFAKNESANNEVGKAIGMMNKDGKFVRNGRPIIITFLTDFIIGAWYDLNDR